MALGDLHEATAAGTTDLYYVDAELYGTPEYGSIYVLDAERPALVDTGTGRHYETVLDAMRRVGVAPAELEAIVLTHVHLDHAGGAGYLAEVCEHADVYVHERGAHHLVDPERLWAGTKRAVGEQIEFYAEPRPLDPDRVVEFAGGDTVDLGDHTLVVHDAFGHAPHQAVLYDPTNDGVFAADAAGIHTPALDGVEPTSPPPDFDLEGCLADVETLQELDPAALYYGHFGDFETGDLLAEYARVLEEWVADVRAARERLGDDEAVVEEFVAAADTDAVWGERKSRAETRLNVQGVLTSLDR
jgi:glyoxylase-like metal-dependent hydrolase (beta-lactamase superfamily II)